MTDKISLQMARNVMIAAQGLDQLHSQPAVISDLLVAIRRMYLLQIDTINVVARSPYLVLWSRLGDYCCEWLDELLAEGAIFEYWAHAACFIPREDYPIYRRRMLDGMQSQAWPYRWAVNFPQEKPEVLERVRSHLRTNGPVRSAEFENKNHTGGGWWNWKEEKDALEAMLLTGEVMVARRQNFQRVYDLRERLLPDWDDQNAPSTEEVQRTLILRAVHALGIALPAWIPDYFRLPKTGVPRQIQALALEGLLLRADVEGLEGPAYVHPDNLSLLEQAASGKLEPTVTTLLSPFDPLVWDRSRASGLFAFDYQIECYTPAVKRRYGYFTLPILQRGKLIGRLDPKAHRAQKLFEVKSIHLEPGVHITDELLADLSTTLHRAAVWHGTPDLLIRQSNPPDLAARLQAAI